MVKMNNSALEVNYQKSKYSNGQQENHKLVSANKKIWVEVMIKHRDINQKYGVLATHLSI